MLPAPQDTDAAARLRGALEEIDGVSRAFVDAATSEVALIAEGGDVPVEMLARAVLAEHGIPADEARVQVAYVAGAERRRRVRFVSARLGTPRAGRGHAVVELEWEGREYRGEAEGEAGHALELRLLAQATLRALEAVLDARLTFSLLGIKLLRAFDADVVVVLVRTGPAGPLVGSSLDAGDHRRAVAQAVLNATNRLLGNYLAVGEAAAA
jgi:hypothetical protein